MPLFLFPRERHCNTGEPVRSAPRGPLPRSDTTEVCNYPIPSLCRRYFYPLMYSLTSYVDDASAQLAAEEQAPRVGQEGTDAPPAIPFLSYEEKHMAQLQTWFEQQFGQSERRQAHERKEAQGAHIETELQHMRHADFHAPSFSCEDILQRLASERYTNNQNHITPHTINQYPPTTGQRCPPSSSYVLHFQHLTEVESFVYLCDTESYKNTIEESQTASLRPCGGRKAVRKAFLSFTSLFAQANTEAFNKIQNTFHQKSFQQWQNTISTQIRQLTESFKSEEVRDSTDAEGSLLSHVQALFSRPQLMVEGNPSYFFPEEIIQKKKKKKHNELFIHWPDVFEQHFCRVVAAAGDDVANEMLGTILFFTSRVGYSTLRETYFWYYISRKLHTKTGATDFDAVTPFVIPSRDRFVLTAEGDESSHSTTKVQKCSFFNEEALLQQQQQQNHDLLLSFRAPHSITSQKEENKTILTNKISAVVVQIEEEKIKSSHQALPIEEGHTSDLSLLHDDTMVGQSMAEGQDPSAHSIACVPAHKKEPCRANDGIVERSVNVCWSRNEKEKVQEKAGCEGRKRARSPKEEVLLLGEEVPREAIKEPSPVMPTNDKMMTSKKATQKHPTLQLYDHLPLKDEAMADTPMPQIGAMERRMVMELLCGHANATATDAAALAPYVLLPRLLGVRHELSEYDSTTKSYTAAKQRPPIQHYAFFTDFTLGDQKLCDNTFASVPLTRNEPFHQPADRTPTPTKDASEKKKNKAEEPVDLFSQYLFNFAKERIERTADIRYWRSITAPTTQDPPAHETEERRAGEERHPLIASEFERLLTEEIERSHATNHSTNDKMLARSRQLLQQREGHPTQKDTHVFYTLSLARFLHQQKAAGHLLSRWQQSVKQQEEATLYYLEDQFMRLAAYVRLQVQHAVKVEDVTTAQTLHHFLASFTSGSLRARTEEGQRAYHHLLRVGMRREYFLHFFTYVYDIIDLAWREAFPRALPPPPVSEEEGVNRDSGGSGGDCGQPLSHPLLRPACLLWYREEKAPDDITFYLPDTTEREGPTVTPAEAHPFFTDLLRSIPHWGCWRHVGRAEDEEVVSYLREVQLLYSTWRPIVHDLVTLIASATDSNKHRVTTASAASTPPRVLCKLYRPRVFKTVFSYHEEQQDEVRRTRWAWERRSSFMQTQRARAKEASRKRQREAAETSEEASEASTVDAPPQTSRTLTPSLSLSDTELQPCVTLPPSMEASFNTGPELFKGQLQRWCAEMRRIEGRLLLRHNGLNLSRVLAANTWRQQQGELEEEMNDSTVFFSYLGNIMMERQKAVSQFYQSISS